MRMTEFIRDYYDVTPAIARKKIDPIKEVIDSDFFDYDYIDIVNGEYTKMVRYGSGGESSISVLELVAYRREDLVRDNSPLLEVYDIYMEGVREEALNLLDPVQLSKVRENSLANKASKDGNS